MPNIREELLATTIRMYSLYRTALSLCSVQSLQELVEELLTCCITAMDVTAAGLITQDGQLHLRGGALVQADRDFLLTLGWEGQETCSEIDLPSDKCAVVCRITQDEEPLGFLLAIEKEATQFGSEDTQRLGNLATITATALQNVYQYEKLLQRTNVLEQGIQQHEAEILVLRREVSRKYRFDNIIGRSPAMQQVYGLMEKAIDSGLNVLVSGETGTGKELIAKAIHYNGPRKDGPWQEINCGAVPRDLVASMLFGHVKGAFTGADRERMGLFEMAQGGTLILDEIGDMPLDVQPHLLRVLQERRVQRLGDTQLRPVDVRIIAMSNRDLELDVRVGRFREDLYYRLSVFPIHVPSLRERVEDIPRLVEHILSGFRPESLGLGTGVLAMLQGYPWPGNVRELRNEVLRAAALSEPDRPIQIQHFSPRITRDESLVQDALSKRLSFSASVEQCQRRLIQGALDQCQGNRTRAAKLLGMHRPGLVRLIKRLGIEET